jgi:hypothetical protein
MFSGPMREAGRLFDITVNFDCLYYNSFVVGISNNIQGEMIGFCPKRKLMLVKGGLKPANLFTMMQSL